MKHPVKCPKCKGSGRIPTTDLPPMLKDAMGVRQTDECPVCDGTILNSVDPDGQIKDIALYPECEYATAVHYVFDMDELVRYVRFRDVMVGEMRRAQG